MAPKLTGSRDNQILEVANMIEARLLPLYGNATANRLAGEWVDYANSHPKVPVPQALLAWWLNQSDLPAHIGNDIIAGASGAAGVGGAIGQNIGNIAPPTVGPKGECLPPGPGAINPVHYFAYISCLATSKNLWIRVGEGIAAIILLDIGLKAFTNKSVIETVAKKTPAGKAAKVGKLFK